MALLILVSLIFRSIEHTSFKRFSLLIKEGFKIAGKAVTVEDISYIDGAPKKEIGLKIKNTGNTIIRTIFEHFKYDIIKLDCVMIAELTKKDIPRGHWKHLTELEISKLKML